MNKIAHFIVHSKAAAYIAALLCMGAWALRAVWQGGGADTYGWLGLLLCIVVGYLSVKVGRELLLNDVKSVLPATLFFMGCTLQPQIMPAGIEGLHLLLFPLACYALLRTYRDRSAMGLYFLAFVFVGVECLLMPPLLLTLPWLVLCGAFMESLHGRTFFAALWGLLFPYWVVGCVLFLTDRVELIGPYFSRILPPLLDGYLISGTPQLWAQLLWTLLLVLPGSLSIVIDHTMKLQSSAGLRLLIVSLVLLLITVGLFPVMYQALAPCVLLYASLIGTAFFTRNMTRAKNIFLVAVLLAWIIFLGYTYGTAL